MADLTPTQTALLDRIHRRPVVYIELTNPQYADAVAMQRAGLIYFDDQRRFAPAASIGMADVEDGDA